MLRGLLIATALSAALGVPQARGDELRVPLLRSAHGYSVFVQIAGRTIACEVDTGAEITQLDIRYAPAPADAELLTIRDAGGTGYVVSQARVTLSLGGRELRDVSVAVSRVSAVPCLLGQTVLGTFASVTLDFRNRELVLTP